jgi:membrane dipeptidase
MIDMHYDLLSVMYQSYRRNDYSFFENYSKNFNSDNVSGLIANFYFKNFEEMKQELGEDIQDINVVELFKIAIEELKKHPIEAKVLYSIEGCDHIKNTKELEELYNLGLRSILLVWNNKSKYGSGNYGDIGLTAEGKEFIKKAIDLGICIDLSHMNKKTFFDTIDLIKEEISSGKKVKVMASHSNSYQLYPHLRNLDDEQIEAIKEVDGLIGLVSYSKFIADENASESELQEAYLNHLKYMVDKIGIDHVGIASDDMTYDEYFFQNNLSPMIFNYSSIKKSLVNLLSKDFTEEEIEKILYKNVYNKLFKEEIK